MQDGAPVGKHQLNGMLHDEDDHFAGLDPLTRESALPGSRPGEKLAVRDGLVRFTSEQNRQRGFIRAFLVGALQEVAEGGHAIWNGWR